MAQKAKFANLAVADRNAIQQKIAQMKVAEEQKKKEQNQLQGCTFHPRIISKDKVPSKYINDDYYLL